MSKSAYFANSILNDKSSSLYIAFFDGNPEEDGSEILQTQRAKITASTATEGSITNTAAITVNPASSITTPVVAKYWGVYDAVSGGNLLYYFALPFSVIFLAESQIPIGIGSLIIKED